MHGPTNIKYPFCLSDSNETWNFSTDFQQMYVTIHAHDVELLHADGGTYRHDEANSLLLLQALNLLQLEVFAFSTTSSHFALSCTQVNQFLIFTWPRSCMMLSSHLYLGLPLGLVVKGFHLNIFLAGLASGILCIWPNQLSLWALM